MQASASATAAAMKECIQLSRPGVHEAQLAAVFGKAQQQSNHALAWKCVMCLTDGQRCSMRKHLCTKHMFNRNAVADDGSLSTTPSVCITHRISLILLVVHIGR